MAESYRATTVRRATRLAGTCTAFTVSGHPEVPDDGGTVKRKVTVSESQTA